MRTLTAQLTDLRKRHRAEVHQLQQALQIAHGENLQLRRQLGTRPSQGTADSQDHRA